MGGGLVGEGVVVGGVGVAVMSIGVVVGVVDARTAIRPNRVAERRRRTEPNPKPGKLLSHFDSLMVETSLGGEDHGPLRPSLAETTHGEEEGLFPRTYCREGNQPRGQYPGPAESGTLVTVQHDFGSRKILRPATSEVGGEKSVQKRDPFGARHDVGGHRASEGGVGAHLWTLCVAAAWADQARLKGRHHPLGIPGGG